MANASDHLTVAWITSRRTPQFAWFADSLHNECGGDYSKIKVVVVDFFADEPGRKESFQAVAHPFLEHVTPKPSVWQGRFKLTSKDYFAAANTRNTAICLAPDGWIAYVDDLSVLMPGWLRVVRESMQGERITCGAYRKVRKMVVENGRLISFEPIAYGDDTRSSNDCRLDGVEAKPVKCQGSWLFGCSLLAPVNAFLKINGWPEYCDSTGIGMEDCMTGMAFSNNQLNLWYDRRMMTYESEEGHGESNLVRMDKNRGEGIAKEKGHGLIRRFGNAIRFPNYFGPEGLAGLRQRVLKGEPFPVMKEPNSDWHDGQPLSEL